MKQMENKLNSARARLLFDDEQHYLKSCLSYKKNKYCDHLVYDWLYNIKCFKIKSGLFS